MTVRRILVFGASGVGKSAACARLAEANSDFAHLRASKLLSEITGHTPEALRTAPDDAIRRNQALLATALDRAAAKLKSRTLLLDGHAVIDNDRSLIRVPVEAVAALRPDGLLLLEASPETIQERRLGDNRGRPYRSIVDLTREINAEHEAVLDYHQSLSVPLEIVWAEPEPQLEYHLARIQPTHMN